MVAAIACGFCYVESSADLKKSIWSLEESMPINTYICDTFPVFTFFSNKSVYVVPIFEMYSHLKKGN